MQFVCFLHFLWEQFLSVSASNTAVTWEEYSTVASLILPVRSWSAPLLVIPLLPCPPPSWCEGSQLDSSHCCSSERVSTGPRRSPTVWETDWAFAFALATAVLKASFLWKVNEIIIFSRQWLEYNCITNSLNYSIPKLYACCRKKLHSIEAICA